MKGYQDISSEKPFHQENAPVYKSFVSMASMLECSFELVDHHIYSPELTPSDDHIFQDIRNNWLITIIAGMMTSWMLLAYYQKGESSFTKDM